MSWLFLHPIIKPLKFNLAEDWDDMYSSTNCQRLAFRDLCLLLDMEAQGIIIVEVEVFAHVILNPGLHMGVQRSPQEAGLRLLVVSTKVGLHTRLLVAMGQITMMSSSFLMWKVTLNLDWMSSWLMELMFLPRLALEISQKQHLVLAPNRVNLCHHHGLDQVLDLLPTTFGKSTLEIFLLQFTLLTEQLGPPEQGVHLAQAGHLADGDGLDKWHDFFFFKRVSVSSDYFYLSIDTSCHLSKKNSLPFDAQVLHHGLEDGPDGVAAQYPAVHKIKP